jgi:hypothetical protein
VVIGFEFRASLTMDMTDDCGEEDSPFCPRKITFQLVNSTIFSSFDGTWSMRFHSRGQWFDPVAQRHRFRYKTLLTYSVFVRPKGPVPVIALEWRIREDVPRNLLAVKLAAEGYGDDMLAYEGS